MNSSVHEHDHHGQTFCVHEHDHHGQTFCVREHDHHGQTFCVHKFNAFGELYLVCLELCLEFILRPLDPHVGCRHGLPQLVQLLVQGVKLCILKQKLKIYIETKG